MKRLTKRKAFELTIELWEILAKNPSLSKSIVLNNPDHANLRDIEWMLGQCPLCEYYIVGYGKKLKKNVMELSSIHLHKACAKCPLHSCRSDSVYNKWMNASYLIEKEKAAKSILSTVKRALKKLNNSKKVK